MSEKIEPLDEKKEKEEFIALYLKTYPALARDRNQHLAEAREAYALYKQNRKQIRINNFLNQLFQVTNPEEEKKRDAEAVAKADERIENAIQKVKAEKRIV